MEVNYKMKLIDVTTITKEYCELINGTEHDIVKKNIELFDDNGRLKEYTTIVCCDKNDILKVKNEIEAQRGNSIYDYTLDSEYCHITTFEDKGGFYHDISFDRKDKYGILASYSSKYKEIERFFNRFITFRNCLIQNKEVVKEDDCYQYFLSAKKGFDTNKQKIKRV